jgi:hypothetical protein
MPHSRRSFGREMHRSLSGSLRKLEHLLLAVAREDEVLVGLEEIDEPLLIGAQLEEVVGLGDLGDLAVDLRPRAVGVAVLVLQELLLARAVETRVFGAVDLALVEEALEHLRARRSCAAPPWCG